MRLNPSAAIIGGIVIVLLTVLLLAGAIVWGFRATDADIDSVAAQVRQSLSPGKTDNPAEWRRTAERMRATAEAGRAERERLLAIYQPTSPYYEVRRRLHLQADIDFAEAELTRQFAAIGEPLAAMNYANTIFKISEFTYERDPEDIRAIVRHWTEERPKSHFGWLVRGRQAINYAWFWRGTGWSSSVTDDAWEHFYAAISEAEECFDKAYSIEPHDPEVASGMITVCKARRRPRRDMEEYFQRAVAIVPSHGGAYAGKFDYLRPAWHGSWPEYKAFFDTLDAQIQQDGHPILRIARREALDVMEQEWEDFSDGLTPQQREQNKAREWLDIRRAMVERWPDDVNLRGLYAEELIAAQQFREAREQFEWIGDRYPTEVGWALPQYHVVRLHSYLYGSLRVPRSEQLKWLEDALAIDADFYLTHHFIGMYYFLQNELEPAFDAASRATELDSTMGGPHVLLAMIHEKQGRIDEAVTELRSALGLALDAGLRRDAENILRRLSTETDKFEN